MSIIYELINYIKKETIINIMKASYFKRIKSIMNITSDLLIKAN